MNNIETKGIICVKDDYNFEYRVCNINYMEYENGEYKYLFYPNYNVIDLLSLKYFQGIPGLDLDKRLECYQRNNMVPVFISERTPGENRVDLWELLQMNGMNSLNRLEWLIRSDMKYSGDNYYVIRNEEENNIKIDSMFELTKRYDSLDNALLKIICSGKNLECSEISINDDNRKDYYKFLMPIYIKKYNLRKHKINEGVIKAKNNNVYKGRKKISIDSLLFNHVLEEYRNKNLSLDEAIKKLNISKSTFFRRIKNN